MGNALPGKRTAKVMKMDGTSFRLKAPAMVADVLSGRSGFSLLEFDVVRRLGPRAPPLDHDTPLKPGKLYFLVEMPSEESTALSPQRTRSGQLHVGAKERLESLMLSRRTASDVSAASVTKVIDGSTVRRLRVRLPKAEVARLVHESQDAAEAAEKLMQLCAANDCSAVAAPCLPSLYPTTEMKPPTKEKRTRFMAVPDEITPRW